MQGTVNENAASIRYFFYAVVSPCFLIVLFIFGLLDLWQILRILAAFSFTVPCILILVLGWPISNKNSSEKSNPPQTLTSPPPPPQVNIDLDHKMVC